ncbi:unnamed protein product [Durusdinium trenchii]|uniref:Uncharacterized protein n=1 Tax=Durusdinium trenchii TaxID=1381693 RepID=A0ABP0PT19_9DINO
MPPRKKQRGAALAQSFAAGAATPVNATSVDALHQVQRDCATLVEDLYSLRHATETDVYSEPRGILPLEGNGLFPWPVLHGGTFKEIAERAMKDTDLLVNISTELCFHLGLLDVQDDAEFLQQFCKIDVWPPEKSESFQTSVLSWSYSDHAFWRGPSVAMSEVVNFARSIASSRFRERETVTLRLPCGTLKPVNLALGSLYFNDGSQKTLAGFIVWICLCIASKLSHNEGKLGDSPSLQAFASSLLRIRTVLKGSSGSYADDVDSAVARIVKQNIDARVQPVSSLAWCAILRQLSDGVANTYESAMLRYNSHPEVVALEASGGAGPISLDNRKKQAVKHLLQSTSPEAFGQMISSTHDLPFNQGPYGEGFCSMPGMFIGSVAKLDPLDPEMDTISPQPLPHESFITLDWTLPLSAEGQRLLFTRVRKTFDRVTGMVPTHLKKKYRLTTEELLRMRNLVALFSQISGNIQSRTTPEEFGQWISDVESGLGRDEDLLHLIHRRPQTFSMSMLLSHQDKAKDDLQETERKKTELVETQRQEVVAAQFRYFCTALEQDHTLMETVQKAPAADKYLRVMACDSVQLAKSEISKIKLQIATGCGTRTHFDICFPIQLLLEAEDSGVGLDMVSTVGFIDFNVPGARGGKAVQALTQAMSIVNDTGNPALNCTLMCLPDHARDSCLRGLFDEEKGILEACFGLRQHVETRWIDLLTREKHVEGRSNVRRFSSGRIVVNGDTIESNQWLQSELAVCGRPVSANEGVVGAPTSVLPKASSLLLPESASPESDLRLSERSRPSPEQQSAQKGASRLQLLLESLIKYTPLKGPVLVVNWTGYVEELALAVLNLRTKGSVSGELGFSFADMWYLSVHTLDTASGNEYARRRVARELLDAWLSKRLEVEGRRYDDTEITLSDQEIKSIPGAEYIYAIDAMGLKACVRQGTTIVVHPDQVRQWTNAGSEFGEKFATLKADHDARYMHMLKDAISSQGVADDGDVDGGATPDAPGPTDSGEDAPGPVTFSSEQKLAEVDPILSRCQSEVKGDRTQCLMDMSSINAESTQVECLTLYKLLVHLESVKKVRGHSRHRLHFQLSRFIQGDAQGSDAVPVYGRHH